MEVTLIKMEHMNLSMAKVESKYESVIRVLTIIGLSLAIVALLLIIFRNIA